ncbi:MAG: type IV pilin protein [Alphaproteobacteria bacterium]|nr:type IV pilin protein [Alphaproteobacteria bacterium]
MKKPGPVRGFSLLECLCAVAIAGVLAAQALPLQHSAWQRGQRALARQALAQAGAWVEREAALTGQWPSQLPEPGPWPEGLSYRLTLTRGSSGYTLRATPQGRQGDDACGALWLSEQGQRGTDAVGLSCW